MKSTEQSMSFIDHLEEFRWRLIKSILSIDKDKPNPIEEASPILPSI